MHITRLGSDLLRKRRRKCDHVVTRCALDFVDAIDRKARRVFDLIDGLTRYRAHVSMNFTDGYLDVEPLLKSVFVGPNRAHLGPRVSFNHNQGLEVGDWGLEPKPARNPHHLTPLARVQ